MAIENYNLKVNTKNSQKLPTNIVKCYQSITTTV